jgi:ferrochelatase
MKTAIVLFNLGGPDKLNAVQPFLFNLFNDPAIIALPQPLRWLVAKLISKRRLLKAQGIYEQMGGGSTILPETMAQRQALEEALKPYGQFKVFVSMRYWHPMSAQVVEEVKNYDPDNIILLPLYPQFSTTTTASSFKNWLLAAKKAGLNKPTKKICCYFQDEAFINAYAQLTFEHYEQAKQYGAPRILFSAHGIPLNRIAKGDPYQWQVEQSVKELVKRLALENLDYRICYQSRVGPLKWLSPSVEEEIRKAALVRVPIVLVPISFVSEHSETLVELDREYKKLVEDLGHQHYFRVPTVRTDKEFIRCLKDLCLNCDDDVCITQVSCCQKS